MLQYVAVCCSVLQLCCSVLQLCCSKGLSIGNRDGFSVVQCVAVVLQCVAVCCNKGLSIGNRGGFSSEVSFADCVCCGVLQ